MLPVEIFSLPTTLTKDKLQELSLAAPSNSGDHQPKDGADILHSIGEGWKVTGSWFCATGLILSPDSLPSEPSGETWTKPDVRDNLWIFI